MKTSTTYIIKKRILYLCKYRIDKNDKNEY